MLWAVGPTLTAAFYYALFPKVDLTFLAWIALIPLSIHLRIHRSPKPFCSGWLSGLLSFIFLLRWLIPVFAAGGTSKALAFAALLALASYIGLFWGIWAMLDDRFRTVGLGRWTPYLSAAAWVALEWLRGFLFSGFPWLLFGYSQWNHPLVIQVSRLTGVYGVSFLLCLSSVGLADLYVYLTQARGRDTNPWKAWTTAAVILGGSLSYGAFTLSHYREYTAPMRIALLQGNIDQYKKWDSQYVADIEDRYGKLAAREEASSAEMIVWPETAFPGYFFQDRLVRQWLSDVVEKSHTAHLVGTPLDEGRKVYNAAVALDRKGEITGLYAKRHLVPFGEFVPWNSVLSRWITVLNQLGGTSPGLSKAPIPIAKTQVAVSICYEAIFPEVVRGGVHRGGELIANMTNDGWYLQTSAPYQHFIHNIFRAVENDRWLVRADNTGISAIIDPRGLIKKSSDIFVPTVVAGLVYSRRTHTLYERCGDWFPLLCACSVLLFLWKKRSL